MTIESQPIQVQNEEELDRKKRNRHMALRLMAIASLLTSFGVYSFTDNIYVAFGLLFLSMMFTCCSECIK